MINIGFNKKKIKTINIYNFIKTAVLILLFIFPLAAQEDTTNVASQNPSPMVEYTRSHERIMQTDFPGFVDTINNVFKKPIIIFIPQKSVDKKEYDLLLHFHGEGKSIKYAAEKYNGNLITADFNLGSGSSVYYQAFNDSSVFYTVLDSVKNISLKLKHPLRINKIILSGFSAGYGAIKKILSYNNIYNKIDAVLLLDGLHAGYVPERKVLYEGGNIDSSAYKVFLKLAKDAAKKESEKKFLFTHSEIFPGTFVSTTESADFMLNVLNLKEKLF